MRNEQLHKILKETFGYTSFRFSQLDIINSILDGKDTLAIMPTGGGKSLCYQIPALFLDGVTIVISPLISLMHDQVMNLNEYGVNSVFLNSSLNLKETEAARAKVLNGSAKIIYVSPEGILSSKLIQFFKQIKISLLAIDEAHCVSQWGHEFRKDYIRLGELKDLFLDVPVIALTATADAKTRIDISLQLQLNDPNVFVSSFDRPNINYKIHERSDEMKQLDNFIQENHPDDTGIVYCLSRDKVERVAASLCKLGYPAVAYHAGLSQQERKTNQELFNKQERIIVVATIAFGMGIDRPDVRFVAHLDLPKSIESYYQETGRAGRDGKPSTAWMIYGLSDVVKLSQMLEMTDADENYKKIARFKLDSMLALCESATCRRKFLLNYFGEDGDDYCGKCDVCENPPQMIDATVDAQKVLSTIFRTNQAYGAGHIIEVLRGSKSTKITERNHHLLSVYGIGKDKPKEHWSSLLRQLLNLNYIAVKNWEYRSLALAPRAQEILSGGKKLEIRYQDISAKKFKKEKRAPVETTNTSLLDVLKDLRSRIASEKNIPAYMVFSDRTLQDMCTLLPRDPSEFLLVHGVGQNKLENYGSLFISAIRENQAL